MEQVNVMRLSSKVGPDGVVEVRIEGRLDMDSIDELGAQLAQGAGDSPRSLNVAGLTSIDSTARSALLAWRREGVQITGASLYLRHLLGEVVS